MPRTNRGPRLEANAAGVWEIKWTENGRSKRESTRTRDEATAQAAFAEWKRDLERDAAVAACADVRGLLASYFNEHVYRNVVATGTAEISRAHLLAHFADMDPLGILPADVRVYERKREAGEIGRRSKGSTIRRELGQLVAALNHAVDEGRIKARDVPAIPLPEEGEPREMWWTEDEMDALFAASTGRKYEKTPGRIALFVHLGYYTAARKAAIEGMEWGQVDFGANVIRLAKAGRRRTKKRRATIAMHPRLRALLERAHAERDAGNPLVLGHGGDTKRAFVSLVAAGVRAGTPHTLRHTSATHMLRRGVPIAHVAAVLGNTVETVQRVYGHHVPEALAEAVGALR